jgi:hypothetical protein
MPEEKWLVLNPRELQLAVGPGNNVFIRLNYDKADTGLAPHIHLAIQMTPAEARTIAAQIIRKAEQAEARWSPA